MDTKRKTDKATEAPEDSRNLVYAIFVWLGVGTLLAWNFFITVNSYWEHKFRTVNQSLSEQEETRFLDQDNNTVNVKNELQVKWPSQLAVSSMVPNVTFLLLNAVFGHRFKTLPRMLVSLVAMIVLFAITAMMTVVNTDEWQTEFFIFTLVTVVLINISAAVFQGGLVGLVGKFPPKYIGGVFSGQAFGGLFASVVNVILIALGANPTYAALFCFLIAVVFLGGSLGFFLMASRTKFYQHYSKEDTAKPEDEVKNTIEGTLLPGDGPHPPPARVVIPNRVNPLLILKTIWPYALSVFLVFMVTLGCFPAITVQVVSVNPDSGAWATKYFIPVCCFVLFNVGDYSGRLLAENLKWPTPGRKGMMIILVISLLRLSFIPLFLFCNVNPGSRVNSQTYFRSDTAYIIFMAIFSFTNGYIANNVMMSATQIVLPEEQGTAASLCVAVLAIGLGFGALFSNFLVMAL